MDMKMRERKYRMLELRYNPYHDPSNGRFTSGGGSGGGGILVVPRGQKGKGYYASLNKGYSDEDIDDMYEAAKVGIGTPAQNAKIEHMKKVAEKHGYTNLKFERDENGNILTSLDKGADRTLGIIYKNGRYIAKTHTKVPFDERPKVPKEPKTRTTNTKKVSSSSTPERKYSAYVVNKGTSSQYFGLKDAEGNVLHTPNNWKTEKGALNWAKKNLNGL